MTRSTFLPCAMVALVLVGGRPAPADEPARPESTQADPAACVSQPTPQHKILAQDEGTWDATVSTYMEGPDSQPLVSKGVETNTLIGGLWLVSDFQGEFFGQPFHGRAQCGYDPQKGKYVGTWVDSMTARLTLMEGTYDAKAKTLTMLTDGEDPTTHKPTKEKHVTEYKDENTRSHTMYVQGEMTGGSFAKMMDISYTRRAKK